MRAQPRSLLPVLGIIVLSAASLMFLPGSAAPRPATGSPQSDLLDAQGAPAMRPLAAGETGVAYTYDGTGRLVRADYVDGQSIVYTYDNAGNLVRREALLAPAVTFPGGGASGDVDLAWTHDAVYAGYQVWYSTQPYFTPGDDCDAPPAGLSCAYVTAPDHAFTHTGAAADVANNYAYLVLGVAGSATRSSPSGRVGEFGFGLTPGS